MTSSLKNGMHRESPDVKTFFLEFLTFVNFWERINFLAACRKISVTLLHFLKILIGFNYFLHDLASVDLLYSTLFLISFVLFVKRLEKMFVLKTLVFKKSTKLSTNLSILKILLEYKGNRSF